MDTIDDYVIEEIETVEQLNELVELVRDVVKETIVDKFTVRVDGYLDGGLLYRPIPSIEIKLSYMGHHIVRVYGAQTIRHKDFEHVRHELIMSARMFGEKLFTKKPPVWRLEHDRTKPNL